MSSSDWKQKTEGLLRDHYKTRSKISNLAGLMSMRHLEAVAQEQLKNQEAESSFVRRKLWGASEDASGTSETQMNGHTILGDIVVPQPPQPQQNNIPAIAAMATILGLGGIGAYLLKDDQPAPPPIVAPAEQEPPSFDDESLSIGLGQIEDYQQPKVVE